MLKIAIALLVAVLAIPACAGQSDEERCRGGGGIWKGNSCEYSSR
jgi:hypothetical protein